MEYYLIRYSIIVLGFRKTFPKLRVILVHGPNINEVHKVISEQVEGDTYIISTNNTTMAGLIKDRSKTDSPACLELTT